MTEKEFGIVEWWLREAMEYGEERHNEPYEKAIKALEEIQQYREIGTIEQLKTISDDFWKLNEVCKTYSAIGTIEEFKDLKVENSELHNEVQAINANMSLFEQEIRNKAIDELVEKLKGFIEEDMIPRARTEETYHALTELQDYNIDEIAEQMKGGE